MTTRNKPIFKCLQCFQQVPQQKASVMLWYTRTSMLFFNVLFFMWKIMWPLKNINHPVVAIHIV